MEKDHFKDRDPIVNQHGILFDGDEAFICLKNMQPYAKELQDLTRVQFSRYLTSQEYHPRGQKIRGYEKVWNKQNREYDLEERVGRITYRIINGNIVPTTEGYKYIEKLPNNKLKLSTFEEIKNKYNLVSVFCYDDIKYEAIIDPEVYFSNSEEIQEYIRKTHISKITLYQEHIEVETENGIYQLKNFKITYKGYNVTEKKEEIFNFIIENQDKNSRFIKSASMKLDSFYAIHPKQYCI